MDYKKAALIRAFISKMSELEDCDVKCAIRRHYEGLDADKNIEDCDCEVHLFNPKRLYSADPDFVCFMRALQELFFFTSTHMSSYSYKNQDLPSVYIR